MQKITPHLWFDKEAQEAAEFYVATFGGDSEIKSSGIIKDTPSGDTQTVSFKILGYDFMAISAGPYFKLNPSISFSVNLETKEEVQELWDKLVDGGQVLMDLQKYPFSEFYGWLNDKYGVSWQLIVLGDAVKGRPKITPALMFTKDKAGKAEEAMQLYTSIFKNSRMGNIFRYENQPPDADGTIAHAVFFLEGQEFMALDSAQRHDFSFNEAVSLIVSCKDQEEVDYFWEKFGVGPDGGQCGWLRDAYGVAWQIVPVQFGELMSKGTPEQTARVTQAFLKMKKIDIEALEEAFNGE